LFDSFALRAVRRNRVAMILASLLLNRLVMNKIVAQMQKAWPTVKPLGLHLQEIFAKLSNAVKLPNGYQDEAGFHYGAEPDEIEVKWPMAY
jgi:hypothetical protein